MNRNKVLRVLFGSMILCIVCVTTFSCMGPAGRPAGGNEGALETDRIPQSADAVTPLGERDMAPVVPIYTPGGKKVGLDEIYNRAPTVLIFYRGGWCPYCSKHLADLRTVEEALEKEGFQIIAISPDRPELLQSATEQHDYGYRLMSDYKADAALAFGLGFRVPEKTLERYRGHGLDLSARSGRPHKILPVPAAYVIDKQGTIRFAHWNPDYKKRIDARKLLQAAREAVQ